MASLVKKSKPKPKASRGESWQQVAKNNKIKDPRKLQIGSKIKVNGQTRTVKKGDTLYGYTHGKSAAAPGHNKPAGQKNAVGKGKVKKIGMKPADGSPNGPRGGGHIGFKPPIGAKPVPGGDRLGGPTPITRGAPVSPRPIDPGMGIVRPQPVAGRAKPIAGSIADGGHYGFHDPISGSTTRTSPNPAPVIGQKQAAGSTRYEAYKAPAGATVGKADFRAKPVTGPRSTGIARAKQTPAGTRAQGVPFRTSTTSKPVNRAMPQLPAGAKAVASRTKPKMGRKLPG